MESITWMGQSEHGPGGPVEQKGPFRRKGFRIHDPAAGSIGAQTPSQQLKEASKESLENDPIMGGALPQNRIGRYGQ